MNYLFEQMSYDQTEKNINKFPYWVFLQRESLKYVSGSYDTVFFGFHREITRARRRLCGPSQT